MEPWVLVTTATLFGFFTGVGLGSAAGFAAGLCVAWLGGLAVWIRAEDILVQAGGGLRTSVALVVMFGLGWGLGLLVRSSSESN